MATFNKFDQFVVDLCGKVYDLIGVTPGTDSDILKVYLSNAIPSASLDLVKADLAEIATGFGYTGPIAITNNGVGSAGTVTLSGLSVQVAASGGSIGPFQYVPLFNDTPTVPLDPLIGWADYGSALTLLDGETFDIKFNNAAVGARGNIMTLT